MARAAEIARKYGRTGETEHALALMDANFRTGTVVVVGEIKRGKSSLVNALVGQRDLLPVDVLMCTSAPIRVTADPQWDEDPNCVLVRGDHKDPIVLTDLPKWVTHQAVQQIDKADSSEEAALLLPSAAEIRVGFDELGLITIIDTPGVGGLDEHAITAALTEARQAGVLLMVCDASTPITAPEMEILRRARETVGSVIVAVTKTDKNIRRWRSIVDDNRRLISQHLGLEIPVIGVSSLRALDAMAQADPERRALIDARSGMADLRKQIRWELSSSSGLGLRTAVDTMRISMMDIKKGIEEDIELHSASSDAVVKLEEERGRLEQFRDDTSEWEQLFQRDITLARNEISGSLDRNLEQLRIDWTDRVNADGMRVLRSKPQVFTSQIEIELKRILEDAVQSILQHVERSCRDLLQDDLSTREVMGNILATLMPAEIMNREVDKKTKDLVDPTVVTMGVMGAGALGALGTGALGAVGIGSVALAGPLAPVVGGVWIGVNLAYRAMRNGKQHLIMWIREMQNTTRSSAMRMIDQIITNARTEIMLRHRSNLRTRQREIQNKIEEARRIAQESETERKQRVARLQKNREIVGAMIRELELQKQVVSSQVKGK
ncbi:Isoniazid-induced protein IniA [Corynebacterium kalinowskii]|uniref:Isoniazid-induced protein IniA n=1 Tax=Corynebacterium kalinowskii TaxID=2675216 RepID=A0A6B8VQV3_9CORY|nr:dynamin family protein [Corynebacterium kalinowskii]QGU01395.1 Isoniazid-induced protein IniA [Corynebacterium kalinowskii]